MKIDTREKYWARYVRRGLKKAGAEPVTSVPTRGYPMNCGARFVSIESCFPLFNHDGRTLAKIHSVAFSKRVVINGTG